MSRNHYLSFFLILFAGLILRLVSIEVNGLWLDEIWSMIASAPDQSLSQVIKNALEDTHPPLFDILLYWSLKLSGNAEFTARYLALVFGMLGLLAAYYYGKKLSNDKGVGLLLMGICSFNFFHIYYSFEGRFYSLLFLLSMLVLAEFYLFIKDGKSKHAFIYLIAAILLSYTHYYGGILLAILSIVALIYLLMKEIKGRRFLQYVGMQALVLLAFSPCLPYLFIKTDLSSWISDPSIADFINYYYLYSGKNPLEFAWLYFPLLFHFIYGKDRKLIILLYSTILLGFLIPYSLSKVGTPMLHKRYTLIYLPAIFIMSAMAWPQLKYLGLSKSKKFYAIVVLSCILNIAFLRDEFRDGSKDQWKEVAEYLKLKRAENIVADQAYFLNYYLDRMQLPKAEREPDSKEYWLLKTNFDEKNLVEGQDLRIISKKEFPKNFHLYKITNTK